MLKLLRLFLNSQRITSQYENHKNTPPYFWARECFDEVYICTAENEYYDTQEGDSEHLTEICLCSNFKSLKGWISREITEKNADFRIPPQSYKTRICVDGVPNLPFLKVLLGNASVYQNLKGIWMLKSIWRLICLVKYLQK